MNYFDDSLNLEEEMAKINLMLNGNNEMTNWLKEKFTPK